MKSSDESANKNTKPESDADSEATSDELLSDIEEGEEGINSGSSAPDTGPSPDGALDESEGANEAGPI